MSTREKATLKKIIREEEYKE
jgi:hypothetical protein